MADLGHRAACGAVPIITRVRASFDSGTQWRNVAFQADPNVGQGLELRIALGQIYMGVAAGSRGVC